MGREEQIIQEREKKIKEMREKGIEPYAYKFENKENTGELQEKYLRLKAGSKTGDKARIAGRVLIIRDMGKIIFSTIQDGSGKIQIQLQEGETGNKELDFWKKYIDSGDFIGAEGIILRTKRGELTILVKKIELLSKAVLPLPEKFHGLQDEEEKLRKRYLDLLTNPEVKQVFEKRAKIIEAMREFMSKNNFIEVETPLLQAVYGGAAAKPFKTHCDAFNSDVYLSIAPELPLKKALVGGFERVYEITKKFRNEGIDRMHNPEHMTIEWYQSYADYEDGMELFEEFIKYIAKKVLGKLEIEYQGNKINLEKWQRIPLVDAIKKYLNEDISKIKNDEQAKKIAKKHGADAEKITKNNLADELMKLFRSKLVQPTFLIDYPSELVPLGKPKRGDKTKAEIFQPFIGGMEIGRAYSELNDPEIQEENFKEQEKERKKGNTEAMPIDNDFVNALKHGMPPACGVGVGIERLVMLFTNSASISDVILFPFMKPVDKK